MTVETERLILRPWREDDAGTLYKLASEPEVGISAGWAPHPSVEDSLNVLRTILMNEQTWAITVKPSDEPLGSIGVFQGRQPEEHGEHEIGYWIAKPFWGNGYVPEAVKALLSLYFSFGAQRVWCAHADFNSRSRRVIEKCGFTFRFAAPNTTSFGEARNCLYYAMEAEDFDD